MGRPNGLASRIPGNNPAAPQPMAVRTMNSRLDITFITVLFLPIRFPGASDVSAGTGRASCRLTQWPADLPAGILGPKAIEDFGSLERLLDDLLLHNQER
jgi:hypothetical protein